MPPQSATTSTAKGQVKGEGPTIDKEIKDPLPYSYQKWVEGYTNAAADARVKQTHAKADSLFKVLKGCTGLLGEAAFLSWVDEVADLKVSAPASPIGLSHRSHHQCRGNTGRC
jgi:hypothetical protein